MLTTAITKPIHNTHSAFTTFDNLPSIEQELLRKAAQARLNAQAPYSNFLVGCSLLSSSGATFTGCNVERCSYTQTTHSEQNTIDTMIAAQGPSKIALIAIIGGVKGQSFHCGAPTSNALPNLNDVVTPCGHCRQIIWENCYNDSSVRIISLLPDGNVFCATIGDLLPMPFGPHNLGIDYATYSNE